MRAEAFNEEFLVLVCAFFPLLTHQSSPLLDNGIPVGEDVTFVLFFLTSFLFGGLVYLVTLLMCASHAARMGALAGSGIYCVNFAVVVLRRFHPVDNHTVADDEGHTLRISMPVLYAFAGIGIVVFFVAVAWYMRIKRLAARALPAQ